jgi:hypothetical protein
VDLAKAPGHTTPTGQVDQWGSSDIDITRLSGGGLLAARMFRRNPNGPAPDLNNPLSYRGMVAFFLSTDCGASWREISQIDPHSFSLLDFDMGRLWADPWSSRIFYVVQDASNVSPVFVSTNGGSTWSKSNTLTWGFGAYRVTTLRSGRAYFFGTNANNALLYQFDPTTGWSGPMTIGTDDWDAAFGTGAMDNKGLTRVGQFSDGDYVRALYPVQHGTSGLQDVKVALLKISGSPAAATVVSTKVFSATNGGQITGAAFVESDRFELPAAATENTAMLYWQQTGSSPSSTATVSMKAALVRDRSNWTSTMTLSASPIPAFNSPYGAANYKKQGDYSRSAFFYDRTAQQMNFVAQWVESDGIHTNVVRFPQSNIAEEQFGPWESLGAPSTGGGLMNKAAISSWDTTRLDVFATANDGTVRHRARTNGTWASWDSVPSLPSGKLVQDGPGVTSSQSGQNDLFVRGNDGLVYYARFLSGSWSSWLAIGKPSSTSLQGPVSVSKWSGGRLDTFSTGVDGNLWHAACASACTVGSNWTAWENLGGTSLASAPAAVAWATGRIDIFAVSTDSSLSHKSWDGCCGWSGWESQGGSFSTGQPAAASYTAGRLDLLAKGVSGNDITYHKSWDGSSYGWSTWLSTNTTQFTAAGGVGAVSNAFGVIDVVIRADDGTVWHKVNTR